MNRLIAAAIGLACAAALAGCASAADSATAPKKTLTAFASEAALRDFLKRHADEQRAGQPRQRDVEVLAGADGHAGRERGAGLGPCAGSRRGRAAGADSPTEAQRDPQVWLLQIERALKAEQSKEALDEWTKFRRAYPDYVVPKELAERIDALTK
jgi:hypothetical protein